MGWEDGSGVHTPHICNTPCRAGNRACTSRKTILINHTLNLNPRHKPLFLPAYIQHTAYRAYSIKSIQHTTRALYSTQHTVQISVCPSLIFHSSATHFHHHPFERTSSGMPPPCVNEMNFNSMDLGEGGRETRPVRCLANVRAVPDPTHRVVQRPRTQLVDNW